MTLTAPQPPAEPDLQPSPVPAAPAQRTDDAPHRSEPRDALTAALPQIDAPERTRLFGVALQTLAILLIAVLAQVLAISPLQFHRAQHIAHNDLRTSLAEGTTPVGQLTMADTLVPMGTPLGVLRIPRLGSELVFLSGTDSHTLQSGPGHRRDTVLPGQVGASVIMGRQAAFGGPFRKLDTLVPGDEFTTITGQGEATYRVTGLRRGGDPLPEPLGRGGGRLTLVSATGTPYLPDGVLRVDAELVSDPFVTPNRIVSATELDATEHAFAGDSSQWPWVIIWLLMWTAVVALMVWLGRWWGRAQTALVGVPLFIFVTGLLSQSVTALLPNLL